METRQIITITVILSALLSPACDSIDLRGVYSAYETVDQRFDQSMEWNQTHASREINVPGENYVLYVMADSHVGKTNHLDTFFHDAENEHAAAAVMVGDLTEGHASDYQTFEAHLPAPGTLTTFPITGNHDLYFDGWKSFRGLFGTSTYTFVVHTPTASDLYICLDSGGGTIGNKQLAWLKSILQQHRNRYRHCVVFSHVNLLRFRPTLSTNPFVQEVKVLLDLFLRHNVNMVVNGHDHNRNTAVFGPTTYIITNALSEESNHAGYLKIYISGAKPDYQFVRF
ncbi:hypothetical protein PbJCM13498_38710 [Prolixibacter bellariivorans]|uniref:Calcineurin-like phosphoesterase domain-containing protein n=1 Tax=Prolixibacter bellariivorans TaxID=314319 RepID=A0A5M4B593_9BACT|nr:metallophosphoesterase [Prolixibacter bellariivorans]GET35008.1 hypothetical protein PbJCM13498_38710 [Prolixibacter bellariivorans]